MLLVLYLLYTDYIFYSSLPKIIKLMNSSLIAVLGIILIFCFFREKQNLFASSTTLGYVLQFVGKRTLDVYLLHYFFLPRNLNCIGYFFIENYNPTIELFVTLFFAILVVSLSLLTSSIIRLSPFYERFIFGVKK